MIFIGAQTVFVKHKPRHHLYMDVRKYRPTLWKRFRLWFVRPSIYRYENCTVEHKMLNGVRYLLSLTEDEEVANDR